MNLPSTCKLQAKRHLGQNFLFNSKLSKKILDFLGKPLHDDFIIEIGPGLGSLTSELLEKRPYKLIGVERDQELRPILQKLEIRHNAFQALYFDAKKILELPSNVLKDFDMNKHRLKIVGNLPFGIAAMITLQLVRSVSHKDPSFLGELIRGSNNVEFLFMYQKEVAHTLAAGPGIAGRSKLSVLAQRYFNVSLCMDVPRTEFLPKPNVDAGVVRFKKKATFDINYDLLSSGCQIIFAHPRKTIQSNLRLSGITDSELIDQKNMLPLNARAAQISEDEMLAICNGAVISSNGQLITCQVTRVSSHSQELIKAKTSMLPAQVKLYKLQDRSSKLEISRK